MKKGKLGTILFEVGLLTLVVALVDQTLLRVGLAFVPGMLLAQRALGSVEASSDPWAGANERRKDHTMRRYVEELLQRVREFYTTCHLMRSGQIHLEAALERTARIEQELNRLLAKLTRTARGQPAAPSAPHPGPLRPPTASTSP